MRGTRGATRSRGQRLLYPTPSLDLRFAETKSLTDWISGQNLITFTRASSGTVVNAAGTLETVASNLPRLTHNPLTGESLGLLVEEQRTNGIRNNTMQGAVAGTPGTAPTNWTLFGSTSGLTQQIIGTGTEDGINYIDVRYSGTTTGAISSGTIARYETTTQIAASSGQTWTASEYIKLVGGSLANISSLQIAVIERSAAGGFLDSTVVVVTPTAVSLATQRRSVTRVLNNASTAFVTSQLLISAPSGAAIDVTLRIGLPQLEQGAFATSVIPTAGATATRSADVASITGANFSSWYRQDEGTVFGEVRTNTGANLSHGLFGFHDGTTGNRMFTAVADVVAGDPVNTTVLNGGVTQAAYNAGSYSTKMAFAFGYAVNNFATAGNGSITTATSGTVPAVDRLFVGTSFTATTLNGTLRRLTYWPQRLPSNSLVAITR